MSLFAVGIDGGGTKTDYALADLDGSIVGIIHGESISYREYGIDTAVHRIIDGVDSLCRGAGISSEDISVIAIGLPCFGECRDNDRIIETKLRDHYSCRLILVNDAVVAYYGALNGDHGINIVSGTGSIAYGEDESDHSARSGGWSEKFGDEGSCYWIGKKGMELFCKEADGRAESGALRNIIREQLNLSEDMDFIQIAEKEFIPYRSKTAAFQRFVLEAAEQGDEEAVHIYEDASRELTLLASGVKRQLNYASDPVKVSLTGGVLHAEKYIVPYLTDELQKKGMKYISRKNDPLTGSVLLALKHRKMDE